MNKQKFTLVICTIITCTAAILLWIYSNNDHSACTTITKETVSSTGDIKITTSHECKKKYSF